MVEMAERYTAFIAKSVTAVVILSLLASCAFVQKKSAPSGNRLERDNGWSDKDIKAVEDVLAETEFDAFVAIHGKKLIMEWGHSEKPMNCASVRKSIISVLYGIAEDRGMIDIDDTLEELGIDDEKAPLSEVEKDATIRDLLTSRSGIYIRSQGENRGMEKRRPERGDHRPGEHFYYNNWGFNVLGTIFERETGMTIGEAIYEWLARPTGMRHFQPSHVIYSEASYTEHRMYRIYMTAEDLARIGVLMAREGRWNGKQVVPADWVEESTRAYSEVTYSDRYEAYGYLWWLDVDEGTIWADGSGGQFMMIDPEHDLVLVGRNNTGTTPLGVFAYGMFGKDARAEHIVRIHHMLLSGPGL